MHRNFLRRFFYFLLFLGLTLYAKNPLDYEDGFCINCHNVDAETLAQKWSKEEWMSLKGDVEPFIELHKNNYDVIRYLESLEFKNEFPTFITYMINHGNDKTSIELKDDNFTFKFISVKATRDNAEVFFKRIKTKLKDVKLDKRLSFELVQTYSEVVTSDAIFKVLFFITPMEVVIHWKFSLNRENEVFEVEGRSNEFNGMLDELLKSSKILI